MNTVTMKKSRVNHFLRNKINEKDKPSKYYFVNKNVKQEEVVQETALDFNFTIKS